MPLTSKPTYIHEPTHLQCGQAVLAMLCDKGVDEIISVVGTERETTLKQMFSCLDFYGVKYSRTRVEIKEKADLPNICILSLETPKCWHWSLYFGGTFYDPEYGVLNDFPPSNRRYCFEIFE